jgi:hypothetical protein
MRKPRTLLQAQKTLLALALTCAAWPRMERTPFYVTTYVSSNLTTCPPYCNNPARLGRRDNFYLRLTAISSPPGVPSRTKCTYGLAGPVNWSIQPTLNVAGAVYTIEEAHAVAGSASSNIVMNAFSSMARFRRPAPTVLFSKGLMAATDGRSWDTSPTTQV